MVIFNNPVLLLVLTDLEVVDTLDIAFKNFSLVGGEDAFVNECGGSTNLDRGGLLQNEKIVNVSIIYSAVFYYVYVVIC